MSRKSDLVAHEVRAFAKARHVGRKDLMSFCDEPVRDAPPAPAAVPGAVYEDECPAARLFLRRRCGPSRGSGWRFRYRFDDIPSRRSAVCLNTNISTGAQTPKSAACSTGFASASCAWVRRRTARAARSPSRSNEYGKALFARKGGLSRRDPMALAPSAHRLFRLCADEGAIEGGTPIRSSMW
jgi:hypothetical protein